MHLAYIRTRKPKEKPKHGWLALRQVARMADKDAKFLEEHGISKEEYIQRILSRRK